MSLVLYHYWRSSCSWRVRWALLHKDVPFKTIPINLLAGDQQSLEFKRKNPLATVPCLQVGSDYLADSTAIIEWLEERYPQRPLLPSNPIDRAQVRGVSLAIAAGIQPLQNLKVLRYIGGLGADQQLFAAHWIAEGMGQVEDLLRQSAGNYSFGGEVTMADLYLVPQVYNLKRFGLSLDRFPVISRVYENCIQLEACMLSAPEKQEGAII